MTKSKYSRGGLYEQMQTLYRTVDIEDCFLSTAVGQPIVRRFGSKSQREYARSRTERVITTLRELQDNCPEIEACQLVNLDGLIMATTVVSNSDGDGYLEAAESGAMSLGKQLTQAAGQKSAEYVRLVGSWADLLLYPIDDSMVLMLLLRDRTISETTQLSIRQTIARLAEISAQ